MYNKFVSSDPIGTANLQLDQAAISRLEQYCRENLVCTKCGKKIPDGDAFHIYAKPAADKEGLDVRIAHYTCMGYEADGKTPLKDRLFFPQGGK